MRFVARLAIALATVLSSAIVCWGQTPSQRFGAASTPPRGAMRAAGLPAPAPPGGLEGTWVTDNDGSESPQPLLSQPSMMQSGGMQQGGMPYDGMQPGWAPGGGAPCDENCALDGSCADGSCGNGFCGDELSSCGPGGPGGPFAGPGALGHKHGCFDLFAELQSHRRCWVAVDYLSFWAKGNPLPPLVTTSPLGTPQSQAGILPESATTAILFGNGRVDSDQRNGARINFGYWLIDGEFLGIEGGYFALQQQNTTFHAASNFTEGVPPTDQILARPFFNVDPNLPQPAQDAALVAFPNFTLGNTQGQLSGSVDVRTTSNIQSGNADLRRIIWVDFTQKCRLDLLLGYRFFRLDDSVTINDQSTFIATSGPLADTVFTSQDQFSVRNVFNGGEIGLKGQQYFGPCSIELIGKCAFGNNREVVYINGSNTLTTLGTTVTNAGGLLAQPSNIGQAVRDTFAILPEANANFRIDITRNLRATFGYTFIYMNRVQRSGDAINLNLNPTQINGGTLIGPAQPAFAFHDSTFWVQGVSAGFEYRW